MFNSLGDNPDMGDIEFLAGFASGLSTMGDMADKRESIAANVFLRTYDMLHKKYQGDIDDLKSKLEMHEEFNNASKDNNCFDRESRPDATVILTSPKCGTTRYIIGDVLCRAFYGNDVIYIGEYHEQIIRDMIDIYYNDKDEETISKMMTHIQFITPSSAFSQEEFIKFINDLDVSSVYVDNVSLFIKDVNTEYKLNNFLFDFINHCSKVSHLVVSYQYDWTKGEYDCSRNCYFTSANSIILLSKPKNNETENGFVTHYKTLKNEYEFGKLLYPDPDEGDYLLKLKKIDYDYV